jgi:N,N'-diacetyllegionaminate synthase
VEIIAELAQGFEGRPELARLLMKAAAAAGADAAKYQLVYADELATPDYKHYALFKSLEMADDVWEGLASYAAELRVGLQLDIFGPRSLHLAERIGASAVKLHGTDIANHALLGEVARSAAPRVLLGAGGSHADELQEALSLLGDKPVVVLLGFQGYPTPDETNHIGRVRLLVERFHRVHPNVSVGFADHASPESTLRYGLASTAIGAGATVLEKHLTLGRCMKLEDHESALNPDEFAEFVQMARACGQALGPASHANDFDMSDTEKAYRTMIRRHVVASRSLRKGITIAPSDLSLKRTSAEQPITALSHVYGKALRRDLEPGAPVLSSDIE